MFSPINLQYLAAQMRGSQGQILSQESSQSAVAKRELCFPSNLMALGSRTATQYLARSPLDSPIRRVLRATQKLMVMIYFIIDLQVAFRAFIFTWACTSKACFRGASKSVCVVFSFPIKIVKFAPS